MPPVKWPGKGEEMIKSLSNLSIISNGFGSECVRVFVLAIANHGTVPLWIPFELVQLSAYECPGRQTGSLFFCILNFRVLVLWTIEPEWMKLCHGVWRATKLGGQVKVRKMIADTGHPKRNFCCHVWDMPSGLVTFGDFHICATETEEVRVSIAWIWYCVSSNIAAAFVLSSRKYCWNPWKKRQPDSLPGSQTHQLNVSIVITVRWFVNAMHGCVGWNISSHTVHTRAHITFGSASMQMLFDSIGFMRTLIDQLKPLNACGLIQLNLAIIRSESHSDHSGPAHMTVHGCSQSWIKWSCRCRCISRTISVDVVPLRYTAIFHGDLLGTVLINWMLNYFPYSATIQR